MSHTHRSSNAPSPQAGVATLLGGSLEADGGGAPSPLLRASWAISLALASLALLALASVAVAAPKSNIGVLGGPANSGTSGGQFSNPFGIAVNRTGNGGVPAGSLYVVDQSSNRSQQFEANGTFVRAWGENVVSTGADNGGTNEVQKITVRATSGTFTLSFSGQPTAPLPYNASATEVETALSALSSIGGVSASVSVSGGPGDATGSNPYLVTFGGSLAGTNVAQIAIESTNLGLPVGAELTCSSSTTATTTHFQWLRNGAPIATATAAAYTTTAADAGESIQCQVTKLNANAGSTQVSNPPFLVSTAPSPLPPTAPATIAAPSPANPAAGKAEACSPGSWTGAESFEYQWYRNGVALTGNGANTSAYTVQAADVTAPAVFQCAVTGTNAGGKTTKVSQNRATGSPPGAPSPAAPPSNTTSPVVSVATPAASTAATETEGVSVAEVCKPGVDVCRAGEATAAAGGMSSPQGIAIDQSNGNVYVSDSGNRRIDVYSATGTFQGAFGWGAVDGTATFQYCTTTCHTPGTTAPSTGNVPGGQFGAAIGGLAVDSSGKVYVADKTNRRVDIFTPTIVSGVVTAVEFTKAFGWGAENGNAEYQVCNAPTVCHAPAAAGTGLGQFGTNSPSFIALDSSGNLYALDTANKRVEKFDTTPAPIASPTFDASAAITAAFGTGSLYGLDFDPAGNHLYVAGSNSVSNPVNQVRVAEMSASGTAVAVHGTDLTIATANALAVAPASLGGNLFLSSEYAGKSRVYVLNEAPVANPVTTFTATTATFTGTVVSNSSPVTYQFEYSADNGAHWTKAPTSAASVPATAGTVAVSQSVTGLASSHAYKVRLVQTMPVSGFTATSPEVSFTTRGPILSGTEILWPSVTLTSATVRAEVNPNGEDTSYRFEYVTAAQFEASGFAGASVAPTGVAGVGHGSSPVPVTQQLSGLSPATTYYFRVSATSNAATAVGPELTFNTFSTQPSFGGCPNESLRTAGPVGGLPDCRAYEQASPVDKNGLGVSWGSTTVVEASAKGNGVTFSDLSGLPTSGGLTNTNIIFVASRSGGSWSTDGLLPPSPPSEQGFTFGWNEDLSISAGTVFGSGTEPASEGLFLHDITTASWQLAVSGKEAGASPESGTGPAGFAGDSSRLLFESNRALATGAVAGKQNAYELNEGTVSLVGRVPANPATETSCDDEAGTACVASTTGAIVGPYRWYQESSSLVQGGPSYNYLVPGAISRDGSRIFFTQAETGRLYLREGGERTTEVSAPNTGVTDANGEKAAAFLAATPDGSEAAFLSCQKLTSNSTAVSTAAAKTCSKTTEQGQDLYAYDADAPAGERLTDLTVDHTAGDTKGAQVIGFLGMSEEGSDVYFAANGVLAAGATPGTCTVGGTSGACNVYLAHLGAGGSVSVSFVVRLNAADGGVVKDGIDWTPLWNDGSVTTGSRVSASGALLFSSAHKLTAYENHGVTELYRYAPGEAVPTCVSCDPTGAPPTGAAFLQPWQQGIGLVATQKMPFLTRNISADGSRVFFDTADKLVPADVNGEVGCPERSGSAGAPATCTDVYEWEAPGAPGGECHEGSPAYSPQDGGCIYLISTGTGSTASVFGDADSEGKNVFFFTESPLVPQDKDQLSDVYDASVGGGLASQHPAPEPPSCEGEACRGAGSAAVSGAGAGTAVFQGPGNPVAKPKPKPKKHHHNKKHRKQRHAKRSHRRAHGDRGGSK